MDDQGGVDDATSASAWLGVGVANDAGPILFVSRICLRRFLNIFLILYRHVEMDETAERVQGNDTGSISINIHHAVAGSDDFTDISMSWDLMPAARLNYVHDFPGMYNCVSQVRTVSL